MSESSLQHYGTPRHSGRYPWGSGDDPYQRNRSFISYVSDLRKKGLTDAEIAKGMGINSKQLRAKYSIAKDENKMADYAQALRLKEKGWSTVAIGERMGMNESSVRSLLDPAVHHRRQVTMATANSLAEQVKKDRYLDIGSGANLFMNISQTKLDTSVALLEEKGYAVHKVKVKQLGTGHETTVKVLAPPGTEWAEVNFNKDRIKMVNQFSDDGGLTYEKPPTKPKSISSDRIMVRYGDEGGRDKDGVIELRRGLEDLSLGQDNYSQVRIAVNGTHYLKGMAVYNDNMPKGVDVIFNTNKNKNTPIMADDPDAKQIFKSLKDDPENPFGANVKHQYYTDKNGKQQLSAINKVNEEGTWEQWKKSLPSQMLSKQQIPLAQKQLALAYDAKKAEFDEIMAYTNPVVKKKLLESFADTCDASSVHLEAAALPRQSTHVLLPLTTIKDTEIYAPRYRDGEKVVLIRFPHGGKFEIPELTVNNKNKEGDSVITKKSKDAVGISSKVAEQLSGADFDGDTVLVIPQPKGPYKIRTELPLEKLKDFDPKESYPAYEGMPRMTSHTKGIEMGKVSNLITDMTIAGATNDEIAKAVRHSMVVIDAEKHHLDYKRSYLENDIKELSKKYQGKVGGGAATLISRSTSAEKVPVRKELGIDPKTGKKLYADRTDNEYVDWKTGKTKTRLEDVPRMMLVDDAMDLVSDQRHPMEIVYARHANSLKALANEARKESLAIKNPKISPSAKETYKEEVASLKSKLNIALKNAPLERQAQLIANVNVDAKKSANPGMSREQIKKEENRALERARLRMGANKKDVLVEITDREWEAIQANAIGSSVLTKILNNTDQDRVKQLATPKKKPTMSASRVARARAMLNKGCTRAEVADALGVSVSTLSRVLN